MREIKTIVFDLDNTLYAKESGLLSEVNRRIQVFITKNFNLSEEDAIKLRRRLFEQYGTTLSGLMAEKNVDAEKYLEFVHNINANEFLKRNEELIRLLEGIKQKKIIFTNSPMSHVLKVLNVLGIERFFSDIIDIHSLDFIPKPSEEAFKKLFKGKIKPKESMIIDDYEHNLKPAKKFGMTTVLVGNDNCDKPYIDYYINKITDIEKILRK
ncbi:MAG: pyrimidine 5'-nucleotidase [Nanoarchaeota archaeon]|nr:pyrimidine 5'-nucleotidase [Nanoarchaeota archaeon]